MARKAFLIILSEQNKGRRFPLTSDVYSCGRSLKNDISVNDPFLSKKHCEFKKTMSGSYLLVDLGSKNGTFVNGKTVRFLELKNHDIITIGSVQLLYLYEKNLNLATYDTACIT
ncbi:MAG TPA: hypothetical protein DD381_06940 [Lentisphaeria bacterium]|nr:MAG: hypothetical protein A2X47_05435 [Lentisphaerae bacterium GWF2_38_69]HBM16059.1 hypothetical protein [Lentisphaeria bacterium]